MSYKSLRDLFLDPSAKGALTGTRTQEQRDERNGTTTRAVGCTYCQGKGTLVKIRENTYAHRDCQKRQLARRT